MEHDEGCAHCRYGCQHPHTYDEKPDLHLHVDVQVPCAYGVIGSRVPRGPATLTDFRTGLTLAADSWQLVRCVGCGTEVRCPTDMVPRFAPRDTDGTTLLLCGVCMAGAGRPEYN